MAQQKELNDIEYMRVACANCFIVDGHYAYVLNTIREMHKHAVRTDIKVQMVEGFRWFEMRMCFSVTSDYPYSAIRSLMYELRKRIGNRPISRIKYSIFAGQLSISIPMYEMTIAESKEYNKATHLRNTTAANILSRQLHPTGSVFA